MASYPAISFSHSHHLLSVKECVAPRGAFVFHTRDLSKCSFLSLLKHALTQGWQSGAMHFLAVPGIQGRRWLCSGSLSFTLLL